ARDQHRNGGRVAEAAGHFHLRRADFQPGADALHHARDLSLVRWLGPADGPAGFVGVAGDGHRRLVGSESRRDAEMNLSAPFIHPPVGTTLLTIAVFLSGALGYQWLSISALPNIDNPTINVTATLPGGSPETMASAVATPLERQFGRIAGVSEMTSTSTLGSS